MKKPNGLEQMLLLSITFTIVLLLARIAYTGKLMYLFFAWNIFLAVIPVLASRRLANYTSGNTKPWLLFMLWLLFFPNAPYLVTDVFHFGERPPAPVWFDLLLVISAAWNGLMLGIISLVQAEAFLLRRLHSGAVRLIVGGCIVLCAFGVYLGRYLRFNSWDVVTNPLPLAGHIASRILHPFGHAGTWAFTFSFAALLWIAYGTVKQLTLYRVGGADNNN